MIRSNPNGDYPNIDKTCYIDPDAVIIGKVKFGKNVFVGPGAVIRADEDASSISIGNDCNIQDRVIIHALSKSTVVVGEKTSLSHGCIIHGPCKIGKACFIGFGSVIFNAELGDGVFVKLMAGVSGVKIKSQRMVPDGTVVDTEKKANTLKTVSRQSREFSKRVLRANLDLLQGYRKHVADSGKKQQRGKK